MPISTPKLSAEAEYLYEEALNYYILFGKYPQNEKEAMRLFRKSAALGCLDAYVDMAEVYSNGGAFRDSKLSGNYKKAIDCYIEGASNGSIYCYFCMAELYAATLKDELNAKKCFNLCAEKIKEKSNGIDRWVISDDNMNTIITWIISSVPYALGSERDEYNLTIYHNLMVEFSLAISDKVVEKYEEILKTDTNHKRIPDFQKYKEYLKNQLPQEKVTTSLQMPVAPLTVTQALPEVLAWLCTQNSLPLAMLRQKLLPLGLMPSAVINDVNERAFDVAGEPALEEAAETVTVQRKVLLQVLAAW